MRGAHADATSNQQIGIQPTVIRAPGWAPPSFASKLDFPFLNELPPFLEFGFHFHTIHMRLTGAGNQFARARVSRTTLDHFTTSSFNSCANSEGPSDAGSNP